MDDPDPAGENRTFKINFGSEGVSMLRERVKEKLKEYMGDYTDDTLVEYVLVLLRNGRSKDEAWRELNVFLGEDSVAFVSWLWDHLSSNLHLYAQPKESSPDEMFKINRMLDDQPGRQNSQLESVRGEVETDSDTERGNLSRTSRVRRKREWKGLVQEEFPLRSTVAKILRSDTDNHGSNARHSPPMREVGKKRIREDDQHQTKRDAPSHPVIGATRRLLQFAVRDAVRTVQQASSRTEPASKRLRSVVSTSTAESLRERPQKLRSVARVPGALSTALKAAAEAAEDVTKDRYSGSVFDRLSHGAHAANREHIKGSSVYAEHILEDGEYENADQIPTSKHAEFYQRSYDGNFTGDMTMLERESEMAADSASDNDEYNNLGVVRQGSSVSQCASSANKDKKSLTLQYSVAQDADEVVRNTRLIDEELTTGAAAKASSKIVNISVNVNTWKPPHYEMPRDHNKVESRKAVDKSEVNEVAANPQLPEQNNTTKTLKEIAHADVPKEPQKALMSTPGSYTTSRPSVDVDSRTLFVSNVHFAATKDTLSRHFNKFGEVLKVIIVNDAATGQPKGSAYVEFLRKESAESALSLNGTSFMSRILKVVQKSSMHHEAAAMMGWPRVARASPFASRLGRVPFPRGVIPGTFRSRLPLKPGARSLQWKRGGSAPQTTAEAAKSSQPVTNVPSPTGRNLTYIRPESKVEPNPGQA